MKIVLVLACFIILKSGDNYNDNITLDPWEKAQHICAENRNWIPGFITDSEKVYNKEKRLVENTVWHIKISGDDPKDLQAVLIKSIYKGKNNTEEEKDEFEKCKADYLTKDLIMFPFQVHENNEVRYISTNSYEKIKGKNCIIYTYEQLIDGTCKITGKAWIEESSGIPLKTDFKRKDSFEAYGATISNLTGTVVYNDSLDKWYPVSILLHGEVTTNIMLFYSFKGFVNSFTEYSGYYQVK